MKRKRKISGYYIANGKIKVLYERREPLQAFTRGPVHRRK